MSETKFTSIEMDWTDTGARVLSSMPIPCPTCGSVVAPNIEHVCGDRKRGTCEGHTLDKPALCWEEKYDCPNDATIAVGSGRDNWHLCEKCAAHTQFKRYRKRVPLGRKDSK